jgi:hypothetical protein
LSANKRRDLSPTYKYSSKLEKEVINLAEDEEERDE